MVPGTQFNPSLSGRIEKINPGNEPRAKMGNKSFQFILKNASFFNNNAAESETSEAQRWRPLFTKSFSSQALFATKTNFQNSASKQQTGKAKNFRENFAEITKSEEILAIV